MKKQIFATLLLGICLVYLSVNPVNAQGGGYTIVDLGTLGGRVSGATYINDIGQVAGFSERAPYSGNRAILWSQESGMLDLGTLGDSYAVMLNNRGQVTGSSGNYAFLWTKENGVQGLALGVFSYPEYINNLGDVVGYWQSGSGTRAFLWTEGGMQDLGTLGGLNSRAFMVNNKRQVIGSSELSSGYGSHAFLWTKESGMQDLGTLGGRFSYAYSINDLGQIVGTSTTASSAIHVFLWTQESGMQDLGTLGYDCVTALINEKGQVTGTCDTIEIFPPGPWWPGAYIQHAYFWTPKNGMIDLGTLGNPDSETRARAINDLGQVVGTIDTASGTPHAFVWTQEGGMQDLGTLGGDYSYASSINNLGQIVGGSNIVSGSSNVHATMWLPPTNLSISIDIKPGSNTNPINISAKGVIPVAVLTTSEFNAADLDPATVLFAGTTPVKWSKQDVDYDGDMDLLFHFDVQKLALTSSSVEASLTGKTFDGKQVEGKDTVRIVPVPVSYP